MNGALPLLRTFEPAARKSCSRIPHIRAHILQRGAQSNTTLKRPSIRDVQSTNLAPVSSLRYASTVAPPDIESSEVVEQEQGSDRQTWPKPLQQEARGLTMEDLIEEGHPERILYGLRHPQIGDIFIRSASNEDFTHALCLVSPDYLLDERKTIDHDVHPVLYTNFKMRRAKQVGEKSDWYRGFLEEIIAKRMAAGFPLTLDVYRQLLKWAEVMGEESLARDLFDTAIPQAGIVPDLECYNSYLGACVSSGIYDVDARYYDRNIGSHPKLRDRSYTPKGVPKILQLRRPRYERGPSDTIRKHALNVFKKLSDQGLKGNESTFVYMMRALGQDGDVEGVKSILKSVWNIDVDLLGKYDEEEIESPTFYDEGHPLRPSPKLLRALVQVFGSNNDAFNASYLLDYTSRNYNLTIPDAVWMLLYDFTFRLAQRMAPCKIGKGLGAGKLPEDALAKLHDVITDEPHNVTPNIPMLIKKANNARQALRSLDETLSALRQATALRDEQLTRVSQLYDDMLASLDTHIYTQHERIPLTSFLDRRRAFIHESLKLDRDLELIRLQLRSVFGDSGAWFFKISPWHSDTWAVRTIPNLIREFTTCLPEKVLVKGPTGVYTIENCRWHRERAITDDNGQFEVRAARLRRVLDVDNAELLWWQAKNARHYIGHVEQGCLVCKTFGEHRSEDCPRWQEGLAGTGLVYGVQEEVYRAEDEGRQWFYDPQHVERKNKVKGQSVPVSTVDEGGRDSVWGGGSEMGKGMLDLLSENESQGRRKGRRERGRERERESESESGQPTMRELYQKR